MKKHLKVLWIIIVASVSFCMVSVVSLYQTFKEISESSRYEHNDIWRQIPPTPSASTAKLNNDLKELVSRYKNGEISVMDLSSITPFEWERVHIFADVPLFMNYQDIDQFLGKSWRNIESCDYAAAAVVGTTDPVLDHYSIFVFTYENKITYCMLYERTLGTRIYTNSADAEKGIPREDAFFIIDTKSTIRPIEK